MEQLPRLQARISNLHELRDLIRALRALAASHVREAGSALAGIRRYVEVVEDAITDAACLVSELDVKAFAFPTSGARLLLVVFSEHGFVGAFNERLLDRAEEELEEGQGLGIIGTRGAVLAAERGLEIDWSSPMATHSGGLLAITRPVVNRFVGVATADIVFARHGTAGRFEVVKKKLLPLDPSLFTGSASRHPPLHQLAPDVLLRRLADEYLFAEVTHAVTESLTSENAARLRVMERADHNIGDKLEDLVRQEHTLRQEAITSELLDVVTGAEAILGHPDRRP
jgi:F-type H+-transporting ATPase subunit gamma